MTQLRPLDYMAKIFISHQHADHMGDLPTLVADPSSQVLPGLFGMTISLAGARFGACDEAPRRASGMSVTGGQSAVNGGFLSALLGRATRNDCVYARVAPRRRSVSDASSPNCFR